MWSIRHQTSESSWVIRIFVILDPDLHIHYNTTLCGSDTKDRLHLSISTVNAFVVQPKMLEWGKRISALYIRPHQIRKESAIIIAVTQFRFGFSTYLQFRNYSAFLLLTPSDNSRDICSVSRDLWAGRQKELYTSNPRLSFP